MTVLRALQFFPPKINASGLLSSTQPHSEGRCLQGSANVSRGKCEKDDTRPGHFISSKEEQRKKSERKYDELKKGEEFPSFILPELEEGAEEEKKKTRYTPLAVPAFETFHFWTCLGEKNENEEIEVMERK